MDITKKDEFVELKFTGKANEQVFDSNIEEDLKKIDSKAKPKKVIVCIGKGMILKGMDKQLEGKELGKEYIVTIKAKEGFGERDRTMVKTIPLKVFTEQKIDPRPGMILNLDYAVARIVTVSGARVITDFNNPLAGKDLEYKLIIERKVTDEKEKVESVLDFLLKFLPEFEIKDKVIVKGVKEMRKFVELQAGNFKDILGKELVFEEKEEKKEEMAKKEENKKVEENKA